MPVPRRSTPGDEYRDQDRSGDGCDCYRGRRQPSTPGPTGAPAVRLGYAGGDWGHKPGCVASQRRIFEHQRRGHDAELPAHVSQIGQLFLTGTAAQQVPFMDSRLGTSQSSE